MCATWTNLYMRYSNNIKSRICTLCTSMTCAENRQHHLASCACLQLLGPTATGLGRLVLCVQVLCGKEPCGKVLCGKVLCGKVLCGKVSI